ncbi:MAG: type IV pilus assembly protein PilM [Planctomycetes bacterium]|nr:type IV pilus assembly protein PilM [Planctomycetota bacterium]
MFRRKKSVVGLDLGSSVVKAVEVTLDGPEPVITGFARAEVPQGGSVQEAVAACLQQGKFKSKKVVASVSGQNVVVRYVPMPKMSDHEMRQAIRFETDKYLPFDLDEVVLDVQALTRPPSSGGQDGGPKAANGDQVNVLLAACKTKAIEERIQLVQAQGLTPVAIDLDLFALANAWEMCGAAPTDEDQGGATRAIALVDVGATRTSINVVVGGETCFSREINMGGQEMTAAVARRMGLEPYEAEAMKRNAESHELEVNTAIGPVLEDLVSDLMLSLDYVENHEGVTVEQIMLSGGAILAPGVCNYIEQATGRTTRVWNPLEGLRVDNDRVNVEELEAWASTLVVALGLASRVRSE